MYSMTVEPPAVPASPPGLIPSEFDSTAVGSSNNGGPATEPVNACTGLAAENTSSDGTHGFGISFTMLMPDWITLGCLFPASVLTFQTWVGSSPDGYPVLTQSDWQTLAANLTSSALPEDLKDWQAANDWPEMVRPRRFPLLAVLCA